MVAPAMPASETDRTVPSVAASRKTGCWLILLAAVAPIATTVPPGATVAPDRDQAGAVGGHAADRGPGPVVGRDLQPGPRGPAVGAQPRGAVGPCSRGHRAGDHRGVTARGDVRDAPHGLAGPGQAQLRG